MDNVSGYSVLRVLAAYNKGNSPKSSFSWYVPVHPLRAPIPSDLWLTMDHRAMSLIL